MRAKAVNPRKPHQMTKAEIRFTKSPWFSEFSNMRYEAITLRVGDTRYTPDFSGTDSGGQVHFFEIKASGHRAAYTEAARLKLSIFTSAFPEYVFCLAWPDKNDSTGWHFEIVSRTPIVHEVTEDLPGQTRFA